MGAGLQIGYDKKFDGELGKRIISIQFTRK